MQSATFRLTDGLYPFPPISLSDKLNYPPGPQNTHTTQRGAEVKAGPNPIYRAFFSFSIRTVVTFFCLRASCVREKRNVKFEYETSLK